MSVEVGIARAFDARNKAIRLIKGENRRTSVRFGECARIPSRINHENQSRNDLKPERFPSSQRFFSTCIKNVKKHFLKEEKIYYPGLSPDSRQRLARQFENDQRYAEEQSHRKTVIHRVTSAERILRDALESQRNITIEEPTLESFVSMPRIHYPGNHEQKIIMQKMEMYRKQMIEKTEGGTSDIDHLSRKAGILPLIQTPDGGYIKVRINQIFDTNDKSVVTEYFTKTDNPETSRAYYRISLGPGQQREGEDDLAAIIINKKGEIRPHNLKGSSDDNVSDTTPHAIAIGEYLLSYYLSQVQVQAA